MVPFFPLIHYVHVLVIGKLPLVEEGNLIHCQSAIPLDVECVEELVHVALEAVDAAGAAELPVGDLVVAAGIKDAKSRSDAPELLIAPFLEGAQAIGGRIVHLVEGNEARHVLVERSPSPGHIATEADSFASGLELVVVAVVAVVGVQGLPPSLQIILEVAQEQRPEVLGGLMVGRHDQEGGGLPLVDEKKVRLYNGLGAVYSEAMKKKGSVIPKIMLLQRIHEVRLPELLQVEPVKSSKGIRSPSEFGDDEKTEVSQHLGALSIELFD
mmetsp:Transcript_52832/g.113168  ORF Transcript_52832/g.113168 Transcript_52832/m.113168 type:complete len:269 (+) Transcript_52832:601-1407(+)